MLALLLYTTVSAADQSVRLARLHDTDAPPPVAQHVRQAGATEEEEELLSQPKLGLVAHYTDRTGRRVSRVEPAIAHTWVDLPPDSRLKAGRFEAKWSGILLIPQPGAYRLALWCRGEASLSLNGVEICRGRSDQGDWLVGPLLELDYSEQPLSVHFRSEIGQGALSLAWKGPQSELEMVPPHVLMHRPEDAPSPLYEQGRRLVRVLRCGACHQVSPEQDTPASQPLLPAPDLSRAAASLHLDWLIDWLAAANAGPVPQRPAKSAKPDDAAELEPQPPDEKSTVQTTELRPMPAFGLTRRQAAAVAAWLHLETAQQDASQSQPDPAASAAPPAPHDQTDHNGSPAIERGRRLFYSLGCLACHNLHGLGNTWPEGGGALDGVAAKRVPAFFALWLQDPAAWNPQHRMPVFDLEPHEVRDLAAFLTTLRHAEVDPSDEPQAHAADAENDAAMLAAVAQGDPALVHEGAQLYQRHRCAACHVRPGQGKVRPVALPHKPRWQDSCLGEPDPQRARPGYRLPDTLRDAIVAYYSQTVPGSAAWQVAHGADLLHEHRCLACHARGAARGLSEHLPALLEAEPTLADIAAALAPPSLDGVGDKLHTHWLAQAIARRGPRLRPWLAVRMPRFRLSDRELQTLSQWLVAQDRLPAPAPPELEQRPLAKLDAAALEQAGRRLVTADGFGCTSCHQLGRSLPEGVSLAAHGTNLSLVGERVRRDWFTRWVRNPLRLTPRIEMPAIQRPVPGVLDEQLDTQLAAVWYVLNLPGFDPPQPNPIRVVRTHNVPSVHEPALVVTDLVELDGTAVVRPILVGLPNRNNVLFELETAALTAWWLGDTARQRTRGKSWHWEAGAAPLVQHRADQQPPQPELELTRAGDKLSWQLEPGLTPALDAYEHLPGGARFEYRLRSVATASNPAITLHVSQTFAVNGDHPAGFVRDVAVRGAPADATVRLRVLPAGEQFEQQAVSQRTAAGHTVELLGPDAAAAWSAGPWVELRHTADGVRRCTLRYRPALAPDRYAQPAAGLREGTAQSLAEIVPGWQAVRLPLPPEDMITSLAWRADGSLVYTSLKGTVRLARDTDGDGWEDTSIAIADGLPAPYGIATPNDPGERWVDVLCKYGLVRLWLNETDGLQRAETVASGWGWTADYHDWAVGLVRDREGVYYVALPCQQDQRPASAAALRGTALRLVPCVPTEDNPRRYRLETICAGLRFPMGLALDHQGRLFATDNQGNYNPFNELNHLQQGAHYGFVNRLEQHLPRPPLETAAIEIPHPWTRSVNGICFLYSPPGGRGFGPFEGHLVGCEYDTRRLIRMTLDEVGGVVQGAAYPFSPDPPSDGGLEGPVTCGVGPQGDLYVGNLRDSGWGGGRNTGSLVRLRPAGSDVPAGIREVRAWSGGLEVHFTRPLPAAVAGDANCYRVLCYRRASTPEYGGPNLDEQVCRVGVVAVARGGMTVRLGIRPWTTGFVYELRISGLAPAGERFFPDEAYYTLKRIP